MAYLQCECEHEIFIQTFKLKSTQGGGVLNEVAGYRCFDCGVKADNESMLMRLDNKKKQEEIEQAQKVLAERAEIEKKKKAVAKPVQV